MKAYLNRITWGQLAALAALTFIALVAALDGNYNGAIFCLTLAAITSYIIALLMELQDREDDLTRARLAQLDAYRVDEAA